MKESEQMRVTKKIKEEQLKRLSEVYHDDGTMLHFTSRIFPRLASPEKMGALRQEELENEIRDCGLYKAKAKNLLGMCHMLIENYGSEVPEDFDELVKLPGVGRKTANVVRVGISCHCGRYACLSCGEPAETGCRYDAHRGGEGAHEGHSEEGLVRCTPLAHLAWSPRVYGEEACLRDLLPAGYLSLVHGGEEIEKGEMIFGSFRFFMNGDQYGERINGKSYLLLGKASH